MLSRRWILTTLSVAALVAGCKDETQEAVWVDLDAVARFARLRSAIDWPGKVVAPAGSTTSAGVLAGSRPRVADRSVVVRRRADAKELLADQLRDTQAKLEAAYKIQLRARARALAADLRESLRERATEGSEASISAISSILEASASVRGPIIVRLGLLVGWPDDGRSDFVRFASRTGPVEEAWEAEIGRLRAELEQHDIWVSKRIEAILSQFDQMLAAERASNQQKIEDETARADAEAAELARKRFAQTAQLTLPRLLSEEPELIPGQGRTTVVIPGTSAGSAKIASPAPMPVPIDALESRLKLWLRIRGYKLASGPESAPDKTGEFIAWTNHP